MRTVDLFCGAGGFTLGAEAAGAEVVLGVDKWEPAIATAMAAGHRVVCADVGDLDAWLPLVEGPIDLVIGGPPCQPFSSAGAGLGEDDERDGYPAALAAIRALRPRACVLENVRGLLFEKHAEYRERLLAELADLFAWVGLWSLDAADFGVPQHRRRVFLVGAPHFIAPPQPTHRDPKASLDLFDRRAPWVDHARGIPAEMPLPSPTVTATEAHGHTMARGGWKTCKGQEVRRSIQRASDALRLATGATRLTIAQCATLQDFPSDYPWVGNSADRYRQVGNAVPRGLGAAVVGAIMAGLA